MLKSNANKEYEQNKETDSYIMGDRWKFLRALLCTLWYFGCLFFPDFSHFRSLLRSQFEILPAQPSV